MNQLPISIEKSERIIEILKNHEYPNAKFENDFSRIGHFFMGDKENYLGFAHVRFGDLGDYRFYLIVEKNNVSEKDMGNFLKELHNSMYLMNTLNSILSNE